ncbi:MAG: hypothetical protein HYY09_05225, partial [Firmicutes bacterium]|nr:hypothetical protein [Bacillota bacterium]
TLILGLLVVFGLGAWVIGLTIAIPVYMVVMMRGIARESWSTTLGVTVGVCAFIYLLFAVILNMPMHWGLFNG